MNKLELLFKRLGKNIVFISQSKIVLFIFIELILLLICQSFKYTYWIGPVYIIQFPIMLAVLLYTRKDR